MSLYNIDENKNMVLDALFAPYSDSPRDVTRTSSSNPLSIDVLDWVDVYGDYSIRGTDSYNVNCCVAYNGVYLVIKHHHSGEFNGTISLGGAVYTLIFTIYVSYVTNSILTLSGYPYGSNGNDDWSWREICYFRIIRLS